jgi:protein-L-isoaspartate(D-aspartate) O-methyltransferase
MHENRDRYVSRVPQPGTGNGEPETLFSEQHTHCISNPGAVHFIETRSMKSISRLAIVCAFLMNLCLLMYCGGCSTNWHSSTPKGLQKPHVSEAEEFARLRERMVREQLQSRDIIDPLVLAAMRKVPRHEFVPGDFVRSAYEDCALSLRLGQTISQPYIVAYMTQALELHGTERVLEIGTGSGYQAAVLAEIVPEVYTIEILPQLQEQAAAALAKLGYRNIHLRTGDGYMGWPEHAPFDRIIVTAAPESVPQPLIDQLKEGGRLVIPIGRMDQDLVVYEKGKNGVTSRVTIPVRFVPMTGKASG